MLKTKSAKAFHALEEAGLRMIVKAASFKSKSKAESRGMLNAVLYKSGGDVITELARQIGQIVETMQDITTTENMIEEAFDNAKQTVKTLSRTTAVKSGYGTWVSAVFDRSPIPETQMQKDTAEDKGYPPSGQGWVSEALNGEPSAKAKTKSRGGFIWDRETSDVQTKDSGVPIWDRAEDEKSLDDDRRAFLRKIGVDPDKVPGASSDQLDLMMQAASSVKSVDLEEALKKIQFKNTEKKA